MAQEQMPPQGGAQGGDPAAAQQGGGDPAAQLGEIIGQVVEGMDIISKAMGGNKQIAAATQGYMAAIKSAVEGGGGEQGQQDPAAMGPGAMEAGAANARPMNPGMR